jgi:hypothetical protein
MSEEYNEKEKTIEEKPLENQEKRVKYHLEGGMGFKTTVMAKPKAKLGKLLDAFCSEHDITAKDYWLIYKEKVLHLDKSIETYNIPAEATINVMASQTGGCSDL